MKTLALDIGTYSVKLVELESLFGRIELKNYTQAFVPNVVEASSSSELSESSSSDHTGTHTSPQKPRQCLTEGQLIALKELLDSQTLKYDKVVVSIPRGLVTTRLLQLPTKDKKLIQKSIAFELEDDLPVELDSVCYDFSVLQHQGGQSTVLAAIALNKDMVTLLSELQSLGIDPDIVTTESWGMGQLLSKAMPTELIGAPVCVVNIGASHTTFHMLVAERPVLSHVANVGGDSITRAIAGVYGLGFAQAETAKIEGAFLLTQAHLDSANIAAEITEDQRKFAGTISDAMIPLVREMRQALLSFKSQYQMTPKALLLTGGSSLIPNLSTYLEELLSLPVAQLKFASKLTGDAVSLAESTEVIYSNAAGLALTPFKSEHGLPLNLRTGQFSKKSGITAVTLTAFARPLKYVAASLIFIYANLFTQYLVLSSRVKNQDETVERSIKAVLGSVTRSALVTYLNSPSTLKSAVNKELSKHKVTTTEPEHKSVSAIDVLNKVSGTVPRGVVVDVSQFNLTDGALEIKGLIDQENDVDTFAKALEDTRILSIVDRGSITQDSKSKRYRFNLSAKLTEDSNVKTR